MLFFQVTNLDIFFLVFVPILFSDSLGVGPFAITPTMTQYLADPSLLQAMAQGKDLQ